MNTTIEINAETLPHLSKRLQKAIKEELGQDIKLATAYSLLAKSAGHRDLFQLKRHIRKSQNGDSLPMVEVNKHLEFKAVINEEISVASFMKEVASYQESPSNKTLKRIELFLENGLPSLVFSASDKKYPDTEASISFNFYDNEAVSCRDRNLSYFNDTEMSMLSGMNLSAHSFSFMRHLVSKYFPKDDSAAVFIGKQFVNRFGTIKNGGALLYSNESVVSGLIFAPNLKGGCLFQKRYFVVKESFFEDNEIYLKKNVSTSIDTTTVENFLDQGFELKENQVLEYLSKVERNQNHIVLEIYEDVYSGKSNISGKNTAYCSRTLIPDVPAKSAFLCSVNGQHRVLIEDRSFAYYQGYMDNLSFNFSEEYSPYRYVADPAFHEWRNGVKASIADRLKSKIEKKVFTGIARKP